MNYSAVDTLYSYDDGDVITPRMGVHLAANKVLAQFWDPVKKSVTDASKFATNKPVLYPQAYSSKEGAVITPSVTGQQWYYNNLGADNAGILDSEGNVKSGFASLFEKTTYSVNGFSYPALRIKGELCSEQDLENKVIYYSGTYNGRQFTCSAEIKIYQSTGNDFQLYVNIVNENGDSDNVIGSDGESLSVTAKLFNAGAEQEIAGDPLKYQKMNSSGVFVDLSSVNGVQTINNKVLTVYEAGLDGVEMFRAVLTHDGKDYMAVFTLLDTHDPYYLDMGKNIPSDAILKTQTVEYEPKVYSRSDNAVQTGWTFAFGKTDDLGNAIGPTETGTSFSVAGTLINQYGVIHTCITATKS